MRNGRSLPAILATGALVSLMFASNDASANVWLQPYPRMAECPITQHYTFHSDDEELLIPPAHEKDDPKQGETAATQVRVHFLDRMAQTLQEL